MRTTVILGAKIIRGLTDFGIFLQMPARRTLAIIRAVNINTIVGTIMVALALVNIYASTLFLRITISHETSTIIVFFRAFVLRDTRMIIFSKLEPHRTGT